VGAVRRHLLIEALRAAERAEVSFGESTWIIDRGRLIDATRAGSAGRALPVPPPEPSTAEVLAREQVDEALCLARFCDKRADRLVVRCSGAWMFPIGDRVPDLASLISRAA
jgi:DNA polymerase-3 subunit epsilon